MIQSTIDSPKRKKGGQPGNLNALKHGLYIEGRTLRNTTPIERAQLNDLFDIINNIKAYIILTYQKGLANQTIEQYNETLNALARGSLGLTRLIDLHNELQNSSLPSDFVVTKKTTVMNLVDHYKKKTASVEFEHDLPENLPDHSHAESPD